MATARTKYSAYQREVGFSSSTNQPNLPILIRQSGSIVEPVRKCPPFGTLYSHHLYFCYYWVIRNRRRDHAWWLWCRHLPKEPENGRSSTSTVHVYTVAAAFNARKLMALLRRLVMASLPANFWVRSQRVEMPWRVDTIEGPTLRLGRKVSRLIDGADAHCNTKYIVPASLLQTEYSTRSTRGLSTTRVGW